MSRLTEREAQCLQLAAGGATNAEIGLALGITAQTAKNHLHSIAKKYGTAGRVQMVIHGLVVNDVDWALARNEVEARRHVE